MTDQGPRQYANSDDYWVAGSHNNGQRPVPPAKKRGGWLKWGLVILGVLVLVGMCATIVSGEDDDTAATQQGTTSPATSEPATETLTDATPAPEPVEETQRTFVDGIVVPATATVSESGGAGIYEVAGKDFEELAEWMGARLPDEVDGLAYCYAGRVEDERHQWAWTNGEQGEMANHVVVDVEPGRITVLQGEDTVDCNLR
ncbi:hypothetical protein G6031_06960 [Dietzia sp. CQ4]|uniref:hypothetical protein n=1 Tax=Dietzia sp. (strain CQ4) TaxID=370437 RepID=UPI0015FCDFC7|nr:hypothetical protein [Dietzia sp. CQ4]MBB1034130.1 hypothetical protein [Dietzia sp. CQ4]